VKFKFFRVTLPQKPQDEFIQDFIAIFRATDFAQLARGDDWP
jgi:hypothetical protein